MKERKHKWEGTILGFLIIALPTLVLLFALDNAIQPEQTVTTVDSLTVLTDSLNALLDSTAVDSVQ